MQQGLKLKALLRPRSVIKPPSRLLGLVRVSWFSSLAVLEKLVDMLGEKRSPLALALFATPKTLLHGLEDLGDLTQSEVPREFEVPMNTTNK